MGPAERRDVCQEVRRAVEIGAASGGDGLSEMFGVPVDDDGRQPGQRPKSEKLAPKVVQAVAEGRSYRWIARDLGISKNTVLDIMKRQRENP